MRTLLAVSLALLGLTTANAQELFVPTAVPIVTETGELKQAKVSLGMVRAKLAKENPYRRLAEQRFNRANLFFTAWTAKTHPAHILYDAVIKTGAAYTLEKKKYDQTLADFNAELARYAATPITDENREAMAAWKKRLEDRSVSGNEWGERVKTQRDAFVKERDEADAQLLAAAGDWRNQLLSYQDFANAASTIGEIHAKITVLDEKIKLDRTALYRFKRSLPGFFEDIEGMAKQAEKTREENASNAIGLGFSLAIDATVMNNLAKEKVLREQIKLVKNTLVNGGIRPEHVKQLLTGWDTTGAVKSTRSAREMIETLSQLMDLANAVDIADKHKYWEALAACLSIFVQHPVLKLIKTNVEVYTNLLHTGLAYATAKARVNQFTKLSDTQLQAVDKLSKLAVKHVRERNKLVREKKDAEIRFGWDA